MKNKILWLIALFAISACAPSTVESPTQTTPSYTSAAPSYRSANKGGESVKIELDFPIHQYNYIGSIWRQTDDSPEIKYSNIVHGFSYFSEGKTRKITVDILIQDEANVYTAEFEVVKDWTSQFIEENKFRLSTVLRYSGGKVLPIKNKEVDLVLFLTGKNEVTKILFDQKIIENIETKKK